MELDLKQSLGFNTAGSHADPLAERQRLQRYLNLQLIANGFPSVELGDRLGISRDAEQLLSGYAQRLRLAEDIRCPADARLEAFLHEHLADCGLPQRIRLPKRTLLLQRHGIAREASLPFECDSFSNELVQSYRVKNGVLHNPRHDRRTTKGTFHIAEGGLPIPDDKQAVPKRVFATLLKQALAPPDDLLVLPFTANQAEPVKIMVSLLIRPLVCPEVPGVVSEKRMEIRFFVPGGLVSNLDFVESIFGNAGDPYLPENDAGLDVHGWSGHTGAVILAPHLSALTKRELGLPPRSEATERQRRDGMCWENEDERYNEGQAFKLTCRTEEGVIVTIIADNYFGYCKKEVKTQISYAANLFGNVEEEHAGGAIVFPSFNLGDDFVADSRRYNGRTFADVARDYAAFVDVRPEGYGIDRIFPNLIYIAENSKASLQTQRVTWLKDGEEHSIPLLPGQVYMAPSGYKLRMEKHPEAPTWRLIGTAGEGSFCHKPCTVSGGGKSEISKSLVDYTLYGPIFVSDLETDLDLAQELFDKDYSTRWKDTLSWKPDYVTKPSRQLLDPGRSLGSVIKLLTPSSDYTDDYNRWLKTIPSYIYALVFIIKRFWKAEHGPDWRQHFTVDIVNGAPGHEFKYRNRKLVGAYLRVGLEASQAWRTFKLRQDFAAAEKVQTEDDITASVVVPRDQLVNLEPYHDAPSYKFAANCEYRLFQRPDDAVHRGLDKQTEADLARQDNFISNFEPLTHEQVCELAKYVVDLEKFTDPMKSLLRSVIEDGSGYVVCSSAPRLVNGKPSQNPRYLQIRPDMVDPMKRYVAEMGTRLFRAAPADQPVPQPVNAVLAGRRNNPPDRAQGIRSLAVYNPIHYQELPELFMDFISSLTGKSPSTTGAGSEGALTKGPFNALPPIIDLNNALVSFILTELAGFTTAAGHIGPEVRVGHDLSLLVPEIWCRMSPDERDPKFLIAEGLLERLEDFEHGGATIFASRLGYRINERFIRRFFGRIFDNPAHVFHDKILRPELQDLDSFADGIQYITEAHERVAKTYFEDDSVAQACPPLQALLAIMAHGSHQGRDVHDPEIRKMFTREYLIASVWYQQRLETKQRRDVALWERHAEYLEQRLAADVDGRMEASLQLQERQRLVAAKLELLRSPGYLQSLQGCLGANPLPGVDTSPPLVSQSPVAESAL